jgi:kumamolisin
MNTPRFVPLAGSEREPVPGAQAVGAADPEQWLEVTLKLKRRAPLPEFERLPSRRYSHEELRDQFGADPQVLQRVADQFAGQGLTVLAADAPTPSAPYVDPHDRTQLW